MKNQLCLTGICLIVLLSMLGCKNTPFRPIEISYLKPGDTVVVFSPSALPSQEQVDATVAGLKEWGYVPVCSAHVIDSVRTLQDCYDDVMWALRHPTAKALYCVRGGWGSGEVMDLIPIDTIRNHPKLLIGYSDISAMHSAWTCAGIPSIYASMSAAFMDLPDTCVRYQKEIMQGKMPHYVFPGSEYNVPGEAEGILIGGNLSIYLMTMGTLYCSIYLDQPYIILLDDIGGYWQNALHDIYLFKHLGFLDRAEAILYGEWVDMKPNESDYNGLSRGGMFTSVEDMIYREAHTSQTDIRHDHVKAPTAFSLPIGHGYYNFPLRMGRKVHVKIDKEQVDLQFID
ncbi:MAG: LD-carboxypeptidase [Paludibacteraceae bacterium]|nr:LD-carboxypeptidase [Paludibacteraceae bacterium]